MAKVVKGRPSISVLDPTMISDEDKAALRARARAAADQEIVERTQDALYKQYLEEERRAQDPNEEIKYIILDMAGHSDRIMLDGTIYFHGTQYGVRLAVYNVLRETIANGWKHEEEVGGANREHYRRPRNDVVTPAGITTRAALGLR